MFCKLRTVCIFCSDLLSLLLGCLALLLPPEREAAADRGVDTLAFGTLAAVVFDCRTASWVQSRAGVGGPRGPAPTPTVPAALFGSVCGTGGARRLPPATLSICHRIEAIFRTAVLFTSGADAAGASAAPRAGVSIGKGDTSGA